MTYPPQGGPQSPYGQQPEYGPPQGQPGPPQQPGMPPPPPPGAPQPDMPPPGGQPPKQGKSKVGLIIGIVVLVLILVAGGALAAVLTAQGKTPLASDEKKVETTVRDFYDTLSNDGMAAAAAMSCKSDAGEFDALPESQQTEIEKAQFTVDIVSIEGIEVNGDKAKATVNGKMTLSVPGGEDMETEESSPESLTKEDGEWRVCSADGLGLN